MFASSNVKKSIKDSWMWSPLDGLRENKGEEDFKMEVDTRCSLKCHIYKCGTAQTLLQCCNVLKRTLAEVKFLFNSDTLFLHRPSRDNADSLEHIVNSPSMTSTYIRQVMSVA